MPKLPDEKAFLREFEQLAARDKPITIELIPVSAWALLSQLQLALRHPLNVGPTAKMAEIIARQLQELVAITPTLHAVAEAGWHPEFDHVNEPSGRLTDRQLDMIEQRAHDPQLLAIGVPPMILNALHSLISEIRERRYMEDPDGQT